MATLTTEQKEDKLNEQGYFIERAIGGHYRLVHYNENNHLDGVTWDDSACEDAYDIIGAIEVAYSVVFDE